MPQGGTTVHRQRATSKGAIEGTKGECVTRGECVRPPHLRLDGFTVLTSMLGYLSEIKNSDKIHSHLRFPLAIEWNQMPAGTL